MFLSLVLEQAVRRNHIQPSRLPYPINQKDYHSDPAIVDTWACLDWALKGAFVLTAENEGFSVYL
jgi:hypothetical protein